MRRACLAVAALVLVAGCGRSDKGASRETVQTLQSRLSAKAVPDYVGADDEGVHLWRATRQFYERNGYQPAWISADRPRHEAAELIDAAEAVAAEGLDPAAYDLQPLGRLREGKSRNPFKRGSVPAQQVAEADLRLTYTFMKLARHLLVGRVDPSEVDRNWFGRPRRVDFANVLAAALESGNVRETLQGLLPRHAEYGRLRDALQRYRQIAQQGGWPKDVPDVRLQKGSRHAAVARLRARLAASGDLAGSSAAPAAGTSGDDFFDDALAAGLKRFERRHGLAEDGILDRQAVAALNVSVEDRIRQLELNLERWRWLPETLGDRYVVVNIPTFSLEAYEGGRAVLNMKVVAGETDNPTPIFSDEMTSVVFSPYWNVPAGIARKETIPAILRDPDYLHKNDLEIVRGSQVVDPWSVDWEGDDVDFRIRQRPGSKNSLGLVKFVFPNKFDVYLHDTPADSLFERAQRDFSHGCVRVEKPVELAQWVLREQTEWTPAKINAAMHAGQERHVAVKPPLPVYLVYQTAWADADGTVQFRSDLYGHDATQLRLLQGVPASTRSPRTS